MKTTQQNQDVLNQFIINISLIEPIEKIISGLEGFEFRDCDIKWIDKKLESFIDLAAKTLGINAILPSQIPNQEYTILNDYVKNIYLKKFNTLLEYFKSF